VLDYSVILSGPEGPLTYGNAELGDCSSVQIVAHSDRLNAVRRSVSNAQVRSAMGRNIMD